MADSMINFTIDTSGVMSSKICEQCGGFIMYVTDGNYVSAPEMVPLVTWCPGHPEPKPVHDGTLAGRNPYTVKYVLCQRPKYASIRIGYGEDAPEDQVWLSPQQALSLRDWFIQETPTLEQLAKEQGA